MRLDKRFVDNTNRVFHSRTPDVPIANRTKTRLNCRCYGIVPCAVCRVPLAVYPQLGDERLQAQQVSVCVDVAKRAKRVVMVSGTPAMSKPFEIFNQVLCVTGIAQDISPCSAVLMVRTYLVLKRPRVWTLAVTSLLYILKCPSCVSVFVKPIIFY